MNNRLSRLVKNDSGATAIEYGMIAALIAVVIVGTLALIGPKLKGAFEEINKNIPAATSSS